MRRILAFAVLPLFMVSCAELSSVATQVAGIASTATTSTTQPLSSSDIAKGLKEALVAGAQTSTQQASLVDGFYKNARLFIEFPPEAEKVKNTLVKAGFTKQVDEFTLTLNRAAEEASKTAKPILVDAITQMTISDAVSILKGADNAATEYLRKTTSTQLTQAFKPLVRNAISKVKLTSYWEPIVNTYNKLTILTGGQAVNPNLEDYITQKTIDGLFVLIADEEKNIRENPEARVTDILKRVFSSI